MKTLQESVQQVSDLLPAVISNICALEKLLKIARSKNSEIRLRDADADMQKRWNSLRVYIDWAKDLSLQCQEDFIDTPAAQQEIKVREGAAFPVTVVIDTNSF